MILCLRWVKNGDAEHSNLPEIEDFAKVVTRNLTEMNEDLFKFCWEKILPKAVGAWLMYTVSGNHQ